MKKFLNQGILTMGWFPRTGRDRYRVKVSGLADEVVRIRWQVRQGGKDGSWSGFGGVLSWSGEKQARIRMGVSLRNDSSPGKTHFAALENRKSSKFFRLMEKIV